MADIQVDFSPTPTSFSFAGPIDRTKTIDPFARIIFDIGAGAVAAKIATNSTTLTVDCQLPVNQAYVLEYMAVSLEATAAIIGDVDSIENFESIAKATIAIDSINLTSNQIKMAVESPGARNSADNVDSAKEWRILQPYKQIFFNDLGVRPLFSFTVADTDLTNATVACILNFYASFLQYEIPQAYNVAVSAPTPVRSV